MGDLDTSQGQAAQRILDNTQKWTEKCYDWSDEKINKYLISHGAHTLIRTGYGMSEFNGTCILENPYNSTPNSCGKELIGGQGIILDEQKNPVKTGQTGNLYLPYFQEYIYQP